MLAAAAALAGGAGAVSPGDDLEAVRREMGGPSGRMELGGGREIWSYDRGRVEFLTGVVVRASLLTPAELQARRAAEAAEVRRRATADALRARALRAEGEAELQRMASDPDFLLAAPEWQLDRWKEFAARYPDVCITQQVADAVARALAGREAAERDARLRSLEFQVWTAEQKAREAEARASDRVIYPAYSIWPDGRTTYRVAPWYVLPGDVPAGGTVRAGPRGGARGSAGPNMAADPGPGPSIVPYVRPSSWPYNFSRGIGSSSGTAKQGSGATPKSRGASP